MAKRSTKPAKTAPDGRPESPHAALEARLHHRFTRPELLQLALTHRSSVYESRSADAPPPSSGRPTRSEGSAAPGTDNEQMEFLGDAVLGLAVAHALYRSFPQCGEGELTRLRATLVSRKHMAEVGEALGLRDAVLLGPSAERSGVRRKPTLLANAAEAVIAAVYLDAGFAAACELVERAVVQPQMPALAEALEESGGSGLALRDAKTLLQERIQATGAGRLRYVDSGFSGPAHQRRFCVEAQLETDAGTRILAAAEGPSKKEAQQLAAARSLAAWPADAVSPAGEPAA